MIKNYFLTTIHTLRQNPLYTALSVFGIALTFVFVCILFLIVKFSTGDYIPLKYAERTWQVRWLDAGNGNTCAISKDQYEAWMPKMKTPEMILTTSTEMNESVIVNNQVTYLNVLGIDDNYFDVCQLDFLRGRPINRQEFADAIPIAVIDRHTCNLYFGQNEDPVGKSVELFGIQYRVVGVVENASLFSFNARLTNANVWLPLKTIQKDIRFLISFTAKNKAAIDETQAEFTRVINETNTAEGAQYSIPGWSKRSIEQQNQFGGNLFSVLGCLMLMLIPALNILSLNVSKSYDRSEEIAVRKAFGAPLSTIFSQLFLENTLITLVGAVVGMCVTPLLLHAVDQKILSFSIIPMTLSLRFDWATILLVAGPCVLAFSFLSGSIPAWITARREIVNVLKGEAQ